MKTIYRTIPLILSGLFLITATTAGAQTAKPATAAAPANPAAGKQPDLTQGIDQMFKAMDKDKNGVLSFEEFKVAVISERRQMLIIEQMQNNFRAGDTNKNGTLNAAEFNALPVMAKLPSPKPVFATFDLNKDQAMDFREFLGFVQQISAANPPPAPVKPK
jgi:Ca2+-binding EF-hand superfamily protein